MIFPNTSWTALLASFAVASCTAFGQLAGPSLGLVPDSGSVRTMYGSAAAGAVGEWQDPGTALNMVEVSPSQDFILATSAESGQVMLINRAANLPPIALSGVTPSPDKIAFSPDGSAAALWYASSRQIQVVSGLPATPAVRTIDASYLSATPTAISVSDDGAWVVGAWQEVKTRGAYAFGPTLEKSSQPILLPTVGVPSAVAFFHQRPDVAIVTPNQVVTFSGLGQQSVSTVLWTNPRPSFTAPAQTPVGIGVSSDNQRVSVAGNWGGVYTIHLATKSEDTYVMCGCTPTAFAPLGGTLYRLTGLVDGAVKLYDAATHQFWVVPLANIGTNTNASTSTSGGAQ